MNSGWPRSSPAHGDAPRYVTLGCTCIRICWNVSSTLAAPNPVRGWSGTSPICVPVRGGYLAVVLDLATWMVVGWQLADHMRTSLVLDALHMARTHGHAAQEAIFHSDHGTQYTSQEFGDYCVDNGFTQSMGRTGVCWDNAIAESFFSSLKNEMYHHYAFPTRDQARTATVDYIEVFYNRIRRHSSLGYQTPAQAWTTHTSPTALTRAA